MTNNEVFTRNHALAALGGGGLLVLATLIRGAGVEVFPPPFYWLDVALVCLLAALPLAASLVTAICWRWPANANSLATVAVEVAALCLIPYLYIHVRTQHDIDRAIGFIRQSRYGEAQNLVQRTLNLAPGASWNGNSLASAADTINQVVERVAANVAVPLGARASREERVRRAEAFAMLGRTTEAFHTLDALPELSRDGEACNLRGTIYETRQNWRNGQQWYAQAKAVWQSQADSPARDAGLARAVRGVAFCERKRGRLREAESAWRELLALAPTAENHFLLAQFYEDTQQAEKAQFHVQQAMKLDPEQFVGPGRDLLNKLVTSHFGCVGIISTSR
jgi:hypothetical protein